VEISIANYDMVDKKQDNLNKNSILYRLKQMAGNANLRPRSLDAWNFYIKQVKERYLIYTKNIENLDDFPNIKSHFLKYIDKLENRTEVQKGNLRWFDLHRTREPKLFNSWVEVRVLTVSSAFTCK
jgi:hypothetical protein